jgi:hypothetical protein
MRVWFLGLLLAGCESMTPSGNPLQPAAVAKSIPVLRPVAPKAPPLQPEEEKAFSISSEELHAGATGGGAPSKPADTVAKAPTPSTPSTPSPTPAAQPSAPAPIPVDRTDAIRWPVRLVTTIPRATPPRAIIGLPDGREIVVHPGSMVPELGLVVIAIAPGSAELARIAPMGDHATIQSMTLQAQY